MKGILENGILANLNTDDPAISGITLSDELITVAVNPEGIRLNGRLVTAEQLEGELERIEGELAFRLGRDLPPLDDSWQQEFELD